jgi:hypothetical protein
MAAVKPKANQTGAQRLFASAKKELVQGAGKKWRSWPSVEPLFLETMARFDSLVVTDKTTDGDRRNGKGDFFNNVLAILLTRSSGKTLSLRGRLPGLMFAEHSLDIAYPATGTVLVTVETKAIGLPKHPRNEKQHDSGRAGSADLDKRIKEAAFKDIDIKAYAARQSEDAGPALQENSDLLPWLRATPPHNWLLLTARVRNQNDLKRVCDLAEAASGWFENCGVFAYGCRDWDRRQPYEPKAVPKGSRMSTVLPEISRRLRALD